MSPDASVTEWLQQLQNGDRGALGLLWDRYFPRLARFARQRLARLPRAMDDEEDVALCALQSFCQRAELGRFPQIKDRNDLWRMLLLITSRKVRDIAEFEGRAKRDNHRQVHDAGDDLDDSLLMRLLSREPDPEFVAEMADSCRALLALLGDEELRTIALRKLEGDTDREIGARIKRSVATVERRLVMIREIWAEHRAGDRGEE